MAILCPITNQAKGYPFEVVIPPGFRVTGVILADQVKRLDWKARQAERNDRLPDEIIVEVLLKLNTLLRR